jgi:hypothetical protein
VGEGERDERIKECRAGWYGPFNYEITAEYRYIVKVSQ